MEGLCEMHRLTVAVKLAHIEIRGAVTGFVRHSSWPQAKLTFRGAPGQAGCQAVLGAFT